MSTVGLAAHVRRGKLLRPLVLYLFGLSAGGSIESLHPGAEAIELLHAASLLHDDIIDESAERRGQPALHTKIGIKEAVVLGDYLLFLAFHVLTKAASAQWNDRIVSAMERLSHYGRACCIGQMNELGSPRPFGEDTYRSVAEGKTGSVFAAAATLGVILGGGTESQLEAAHRYGMSLGIAYQIRDDVLDLTVWKRDDNLRHVQSRNTKEARLALTSFSPSPEIEALSRIARHAGEWST